MISRITIGRETEVRRAETVQVFGSSCRGIDIRLHLLGHRDNFGGLVVRNFLSLYLNLPCGASTAAPVCCISAFCCSCWFSAGANYGRRLWCEALLFYGSCLDLLVVISVLLNFIQHLGVGRNLRDELQYNK